MIFSCLFQMHSSFLMKFVFSSCCILTTDLLVERHSGHICSGPNSLHGVFREMIFILLYYPNHIIQIGLYLFVYHGIMIFFFLPREADSDSRLTLLE